MHIELSKQELKELKKLRAKIHRASAVETIKEMFERSEAFGDRVAVVEKIKKQDVVYTVRDFHDRVRQVGTALYELGALLDNGLKRFKNLSYCLMKLGLTRISLLNSFH